MKKGPQSKAGEDGGRRQRTHKPHSTSENKTLQRLAGTPFKTAADLNAAEARICQESWEELTKAKMFKLLTEKDEFQFFTQAFEPGVRCRYGEGSEDIVRICLKKGELMVEISNDLRSNDHNERFIATLAPAMSEGFFANYLRAMRILPPVDPAKLEPPKTP